MRRDLVAIAIAVLLIFTLSGSALAQEFDARVDRVEIAENETLNLEVVYADRADTSSIDFEAMLPDFEILSNRPSSQTRIVNFRRSSQTSWQLTLMPRRVGRLRIPAFSIGGATTRPIELVVTAALEGPEEGSPFSVRLGVDRERAFIGEQILIRIRITAALDVGDLRGPSLDIAGAEATLVSQSEFQRVIGGDPYQVTELAYAVFSKNAGTISLPSLQYTGTIRRSRVVVAHTQPRTIEIIDPAADAIASQKRPWLPADAIALASEWSGPTDSLRVGEPITRTIRVAAASQHAAAISPVELPDGPYKQYSEQPILSDTETSTGVLGRRTESIVLVPTQPGELRLPPIEIDWWNINEGKWQVARLPGETLDVVVVEADAAPAGPRDTLLPRTDAIGSADDEPTTGFAARPSDHRLATALALLSAVLFACCIGLWIRVRRLEEKIRPIESGADAVEHTLRVRDGFNRALRSLTKRDAGDARRDILAWARLQWPTLGITRLDQVSDRANDPALRRALENLDAQLYRPADGADVGERSDAVDFDELKTLLENLRAETDAEDPAEPSTLTHLYPSSLESGP